MSEKLPLFHTINVAVSDGNPQFREDFFEALRQDVPDLETIFQAEEDSETPAPSYLRLNDTTEWRSNSSFGSGVAIADQIESFHKNVPHPIANSTPQASQYRHNNRNTIIPLAFILDGASFKRTLAEGGKEAASRMTAELMVATENDRHQFDFSEPLLAARIEALLEQLDPARVAIYYSRAQVVREHAKDFYEALGQREEAWAKTLASLFKDEVEPYLARIANERKPDRDAILETHKPKSRKAAKQAKVEAPAVIEIPNNGAVAMLLDARLELKQILEDEQKAKGSWLNRPEVWEAVRKTSTQEYFFKACIAAGAFIPQNEENQETKKEHTNKLLQGLDLPGKEKPALSSADEATRAWEGYFDSIKTARDLSAVVVGLHKTERHINAQQLHTAALLSVAKSAERISYWAQDAYSMMSNKGWHEKPSDYSDNLLDALNQGRWSGEDVNAVFSSRPKLHNAAHAVSLLKSAVKFDPEAWQDFSDNTIYKLAIGWAYSSNIKMWADEENYAKPFEDRLVALPALEKSRILSALVSYNWDGGSKPSANFTTRLTKSILASVPDTDMEAFINQVNKVWPNKNFYKEMAGYLPGPALQKEVLQSFNQSNSREQDVNLLARLMGYGTSFDKKVTLDLLDEKTKRNNFYNLIQTIQEEDTQRKYIGHRREEEEDERVNANLCKNLVFDLQENLSVNSQNPVKLGLNDLLVQAGIANPGDLLTWDGFCHLAAPFLEEARPAWDASVVSKEQQAKATNTASEGVAILDRDALKNNLTKGVSRNEQEYRRQHPMRPNMMMRAGGFHPIMEMMEMGMMHMHPGMLREMASHGMIDRLPPAMLKAALACDVLESYRYKDWFLAPAPKIEETVVVEGAVGDGKPEASGTKARASKK